MNSKSISSPARLVHQCIDSIFGLISLQISEHGFKTALPHLEPFLAQLPRELQTLLIKMAEKNLDHSYTVRTLLMIWWSCIDNGNINDVSTPRYMYNDEEGRKWILKKLGQFNSTAKVKKLSFFMYSFYSHLSTKSQESPEFSFVDDQLQDPRLMLSSLEQDMLCQVLSNFHNLSSLTLPTIANSELLEVVAMTMTCLKTLDISCSTNVTDFGLMSLVGATSNCKSSLEQLFLEGTSSTTDGIYGLLANLPMLEVLESSLLERALDLVQDKALNLRKITIGRFWRGNDILKNLPEVCPKLSQIILPNVSPDQCNFLRNFAQMSNLKHVHIGQVKFSLFIPILSSFGPQLSTLTYSNFTETVNFALIMENCPNLECLGLNAGSVVCETSNFMFKMPEKLSEIRLNVHAVIAKQVWICLFSQCQDLIYVDMTPAQELTDENLQEIMKFHTKSLLNLRSFIVRGRHRGGDVQLTEKTVDLLLSRCPQLKCIGDCSTWAMHSQNIKEFLYFM